MRHIFVALLFTIVVAPLGLAHEGHDHKIMGTVSMIQDNRLEVKAADGTTSSVTLNDKTKIFRGKTVLKLTDIKAGDRVVVTAGSGEKGALSAKEVRLGTVTSTKAKP